MQINLDPSRYFFGTMLVYKLYFHFADFDLVGSIKFALFLFLTKPGKYSCFLRDHHVQFSCSAL